MTHEEKITRWIGPGKIGTEIGPGASPLPGFDPAPFYVDCFKAFGAGQIHADFYGHACRLPFHDHSLDYVAASHVLEHVANPIAALAEWYRVLRPGGILYFVVPNRLSTFDHTRELTTVDHVFADYVNNTSACDATHIDEFAFGVDWSRYEPMTDAEDVGARRETLARGMHAAVARGEDINIHFHTFEPATVQALLDALTVGFVTATDQTGKTIPASPSTERSTAAPVRPLPRFNWEIVDFCDGFPTSSPNGILAVLRVHKGWRARADADAFRIRAGGDPRAVLRPDAQPFDEWAATAPGLGGVR